MFEIPLTDIGGIRIGQVENAAAGTGVTVVVAPEGMRASIDVRGGGPASRETRTLDPLAAAERVHALVLGGGSAFGLDAAGGVMRFLEERGIGLPVMPGVVVPLVSQVDIFDLSVGDPSVRPDAAMGYAAAEAAFTGKAGNYRDGNYGAGCGATVGKLAGPQLAVKTGIGCFAVELGSLQVGAIVVVNACGDVYDSRTGREIAGCRRQAEGAGAAHFIRSEQLAYAGFEAACNAGNEPAPDPGMAANTTIGAVFTNAGLTKAQLAKLAGMAHDGYARAIRPVHTSMDGDSIFGVSLGNVSAPLDVVGVLAADVMEEAIRRAVFSAEPAFGIPSASSLAR